MPCKHDISLLVKCMHCSRETLERTRTEVVKAYYEHHGDWPQATFVDVMNDMIHGKHAPMPHASPTETIEDAEIGVRFTRLIDHDIVVIQVLDAQRGWLDFYRMKWVDLAHGRVSVETLGANAQDRCRMVRAVAMAAMKYQRESLRDLYASVH